MRRVIEVAAPGLVKALRVNAVFLVGGEAPDQRWEREFGRGVSVPVWACINKALCYLAEQSDGRGVIQENIERTLGLLIANSEGEPSIVWAHNQGLGRNLLLSRTLARVCDQPRCRLVFHHHDWWFDNRWQRWEEMKRFGFRRLSEVASATLPVGPYVRHIAINGLDAAILRGSLPAHSALLPNPLTLSPRVGETVGAAVRRGRNRSAADGPLWLMASRLLRRKNIAEALLLTRWLRPEATLVTTAGVSSPDERDYAERLEAAAEQNGWRLRLAVLKRSRNSAEELHDLVHASEVMILSSLQEGFGLPYLEAAIARRPLIARKLPNIQADLHSFGMRFPLGYSDVLIDPALFEWDNERVRQKRLFRDWLTGIPAAFRKLAGVPCVLGVAAPAPVPFSRLTLTAQIEVLERPLEVSWRLCSSLNPWLKDWKTRAAANTLEPTLLAPAVARRLSVERVARDFKTLVDRRPRTPVSLDVATRIQIEFVRKKLAADNLYPLLWNPQT